MVPIQARLVSAILSLALFAPSFLAPSPASADGCVSDPTDDGTLTAAVVASSGQSVTGDVDATGCDIGVYVGPGVWDVTITASIHDADRFGVFSVGGNTTVTGSSIYNIGNHDGIKFAPNGAQTGIGILFGAITTPNVVATGTTTCSETRQMSRSWAEAPALCSRGRLVSAEFPAGSWTQR